MGGKGPPPKPAHMRQHRIKKAGATTLDAPETKNADIPKLQNPDGREFHQLTVEWWERVWTSPMANEYLPSDVDGLARVALLIDEYYKKPVGGKAKEMLGEIRLQEARFGLSPVDRSRLQWEVQKGEEAQRKRQPKQSAQSSNSKDPRGILGVVK